VDIDGDTVQGVDEPGIAGVSVIISDSTGSTQTVTTSDVGEYSVSLQAGSYEVSIDTTSEALVGGTATVGGGTSSIVIVAEQTTTLLHGFQFETIEIPGGPVTCTDPLSFPEIEGFCIKEVEEAGGDGLCCKRDGIFTCTWCDECDYPQLVSNECCVNPMFRAIGTPSGCDDPARPYCCKCAAAVDTSSYKCVADLAECENCLPDCDSGIASREGRCAPFCQNACLALINEQCGCDIRPAVINKETWETVQLTCGQVPDSSFGFGGCSDRDFCCVLFPDSLDQGACDQVYSNTLVQELGLCTNGI
jgi:hypothetical protein